MCQPIHLSSEKSGKSRAGQIESLPLKNIVLGFWNQFIPLSHVGTIMQVRPFSFRNPCPIFIESFRTITLSLHLSSQVLIFQLPTCGNIASRDHLLHVEQ
jgi:hypothetical protein